MNQGKKRIFWSTLVFLLVVGCPNLGLTQNHYNVSGTVNQSVKQKFILSYYKDNTILVTDTSALNGNNNFSFVGKFDEPVLAGLTMEGLSTISYFYLDTGRISLKVDVNVFVKKNDTIYDVSIKNIEGSFSENLKIGLLNSYKQIRQKPISDSLKSVLLFNEFYPFVLKYPNHNLSSELLTQTDLLSYRQAVIIFESLSKLQQQRAIENGAKKSLEKFKKTDLGTAFHYSEQRDTSGNILLLSNLNYKIILIEFWASWCKPCRESHQNTSKLYEKYKGKGLEILGISIDDNKKDWIKAINQDKISWKNVSTLKGIGDNLYKYYSLEYIPFSLLLDSNNKIISRNPDADTIERMVYEALN